MICCTRVILCGEGDQYDKIKRVISIIITDHPLIKRSEKYHHHFGLYDIDSKILLTDVLEIHTLELPKARKVFDSAEAQNDHLLNWMKFFDIKTEEELKMGRVSNIIKFNGQSAPRSEMSIEHPWQKTVFFWRSN